VSWASAVPDVLVCVGLFFAPGLLATYLGGPRGITAWATAPLVTVGVVAAVAVLGGWFNFRFGLWPVAAGTAVMAALAAALSLLLRARGVPRPPSDPRRYSLAVVAGAGLAAVIGAGTFVKGIRSPAAISETWDAVYHYNAIRYIEQTGKASPLTIGTLGQPSSQGRFYPDAWHTMATLLALLTRASIPVAATVTCLVIAVLIWPLGCLLLARHLFGAASSRAIAAVVITGLLSSLFGAFPWMMTGWGVLWPNALGMAMAPAGVALGMSITRISDGDTFGPPRWLFGIVGAWAIGIAHPNSALSVAVVCLIPVLMAVGPYVLDQWRRHSLRTTAVVACIVAVAAVGVVVASGLAPIRHVMTQNWPITEKPGYALVSALSDSTNGQAPQLLLASFTFVGMVACFLWRQRRWLVVAQLILVALYVASAAISWHIAHLITGLWYADSHRIAAILPIVTIPLATIGVLAVGEWLLQALPRSGSHAAVSVRPGTLALGLPLAIGGLLAVATAAQSLPANEHAVGYQFNTEGDRSMVGRPKLEFLQTVAGVVPPTALVADDPFDGTALMFALSGTHVLFPQVDPTTNNSDMAYLALNLVNIRTDPRACALVRQYDVGYMIVAPDNFLGRKEKAGPPGTDYSGVAAPLPGAGFRLMVEDGPLRLYKITICQPPNQAGGPVEAVGRGGG
jgi:hypothetical protein